MKRYVYRVDLMLEFDAPQPRPIDLLLSLLKDRVAPDRVTPTIRAVSSQLLHTDHTLDNRHPETCGRCIEDGNKYKKGRN